MKQEAVDKYPQPLCFTSLIIAKDLISFYALVYPETRLIEPAEKWAGCPCRRTILRIITFKPRLTKVELDRLQEGYHKMLLGDILVRIDKYLLHLVHGGRG